MEMPELTEQEREEILSQLHRREILEKAAIQQQKKAREAEAECRYRASLAEAVAKAENDRREYIAKLLGFALNQLQEAIASFEEGDETGTYRFLVKLDPSLNSAQQRLNQKTTPLAVGVGVPVVKVKRNTALGYAIVNSSDVLPSDQIIEEDA
jgi:hypothetical protein